ncbi:dynamin family protein [Oligella ureolytica]
MGIGWLSSSTSPGQVQELQEPQEIRRRKPLLPVITRSDFLDEIFVDNDIKKVLCNKCPENRALQEEDVLQRAQSKLITLGMDANLVQQPISISVYYARQHGLTNEALQPVVCTISIKHF